MNTMIIVDGHNLIPHVRGISLEDLDDEQRLIDLLGRFSRARRAGKGGRQPRQVVVFFDNAPPGQAGRRVYGSVTAHFVAAGRTADLAIDQYVRAQGGAARNMTVVSSDHEVQNRARGAQAQVISSEEFARQLSELPPPGAAVSAARPEPGAAGGLDEWYDLFGMDAHEAEKPIEMKPPPKETKAKVKPGKRPHHGFPKKK